MLICSDMLRTSIIYLIFKFILDICTLVIKIIISFIFQGCFTLLKIEIKSH